MAASLSLPAATAATLRASARPSPRVGFPVRRRAAIVTLRCSSASSTSFRRVSSASSLSLSALRRVSSSASSLSSTSAFAIAPLSLHRTATAHLSSSHQESSGLRVLTVRAAAKSGGATEKPPVSLQREGTLQRQGSLGVCEEDPAVQSAIQRPDEAESRPTSPPSPISVPEPLDDALIEPSSPRDAESGVARIESQARTTLAKLKHILYKLKTRSADVQTSVTVSPTSAVDAAGVTGGGLVGGDVSDLPHKFDLDSNGLNTGGVDSGLTGGGKAEEEQEVFVSQHIKLDLGSIASVDLDAPIDEDASPPSDGPSPLLSPSSFSAQSLSPLFSGFSQLPADPAGIPANEQQLNMQQMDALTCTRASIRFDEQTQTAIVTVTASVRAADFKDQAAYTERTMAMATRAIARTCLVLDQKAQKRAAEAASSAADTVSSASGEVAVAPAVATASAAPQPTTDLPLRSPQQAPRKAEEQALPQEEVEREQQLVALLAAGSIVSWRLAGPELGSTPFRPLFVVKLAAADGRSAVQALFRPAVAGDTRLRFQRAPAEWVAFKLSRLLGVDVVPPVALRQGVQIGTRRFAQGTMMLLPSHVQPLSSVHPSRLRSPAMAPTVVSSIRILDALMGSSLRRPAAFAAAKHWSEDGKLCPVVLSHPIGPALGAGMHSMWSKRGAGTGGREGAAGAGAGGRLKTVAGSVLTRMRRLSRAQLLEEMGGALTAGEMERVLEKRDQVVGYFDALAGRMGHHAVVR
ncbi:hypothetical protein CLOM_g16694 [Closterium sp. NIES-68]|nr:hypothetical protein CLOM_g16694 [Closterium sp. NIES-68]GJP82814.1 hypothetical protein CLOP_g13043 [Closterium sp. NIES-67]